MPAIDQQALRARYNPDGSPLRELQMTLLGVLEEFDRICTANGIKYWLDGGTCLGAVRHGGFIPWDDDVDVGMFRQDYEKFVAVFEKGAADPSTAAEYDRFALTSIENDLFYTNGFAKFRIKGPVMQEKGTRADIHYTHRGPFVDIFILDPLTLSSCRSFKRRSNWLHVFTKMENPGPAALKMLKFFKKRLLAKAERRRRRDALRPDLEYRYALCSPLYRFVFHKEYFDTLERMPFETLSLPVPGNWDGYLKGLYGDYMSLPTEKEREESAHFGA